MQISRCYCLHSGSSYSRKYYLNWTPYCEIWTRRVRPNPREMTEERRAEIAKDFAHYDRNGDGFITYREAHAVLESRLGFSADKTKRLMRLCDRNGDGQLSYDEFIDFYFRVKTKSDELRAVFREFDKDGNGVISIDEAREAFRNLAFNEDEIENLVRAYDANGDGELQYEEFVKLWNAS